MCEPCAETHRRAVWQVALSGFTVAGRGEALFLTLTAPGTQAHVDTRTGQACPCTPEGGVNPAIFNAELPRRWNRFAQGLRRMLGCRVAYFRTIETQARGALHEHILLFAPDPARRILADVERVRQLAIRHGYGHSLRLEVVGMVGRAVNYVAKYVSKSCDERPEVPWCPNPATGELVKAAYRPWSASQDWGVRMKAVYAAQQLWARGREAAGASLDNNTQSYTSTGEPECDVGMVDRARAVIEAQFGPCEVVG